MKFHGVFFLACLLSNVALAATNQLLLRGTSDDFPGNLDLQVVVLDNGDVQSIRTVNEKGTQVFPIAQLAAGIVIYKTQGHDVVTLRSPNMDVAHGGTVDVIYLNNALTGDMETVTLEVQHVGAQWELLADDDQSGYHVVTKAFFESNKFFGKTIGISSIDFQ